MVAGWGLAVAIADHWEAGGSWARAVGWLCARAWGGAFSGSAASVGQQPAAAGGGSAGPGEAAHGSEERDGASSWRREEEREIRN